jgi:hypothetical protein
MPTNNFPTPPPVDVLKQWLEMGREVLKRYYPDSPYAALVIPLGDGVPDCVLPVTPADSRSSAQTPTVTSS